MSINPVGYPVDNRIAGTSRPAAADPVVIQAANAAPDLGLPVTSQVPDVGQLQDAVDTFNQYIPMAANNLLFSIDEDNGTVVVKIVDTTTQDVIRQIPSVEALELSRSLDKLKGLLLQGKA
ncbi:flagellar protein FlaG [Pigmentiphaga litoralis]|uniref:Flagellar protein FlaG n=1 Tax=Pigmentiphaga litoralis TaxID=516702 RepID=A0A7Y9IZ59_9BURK|nr:flagellar protein FlaG [Pigmentiphaga litoralis]NYE26871.1 flagellar protein FlaG [Pigmentiphaga litoralis]NYE85719.1 flagellar protein FlaG [Pigmentiphaga litoralis]